MVGWKEQADAAGCPAEATEEELGLPLQYDREPEEYGVMELDPVQTAYDALLANVAMAIKAIALRGEMEFKAAQSGKLDLERAIECNATGHGLYIALDILAECGVPS